MKKALIINAHQKHEFSPGGLNRSLAKYIDSDLEAKGFEVRSTHIDEPYDLNEEIQKHKWADVVILQSPVYWMGLPWAAKKYLDEVYMSGIDGDLCKGDGRWKDPENPKQNYGTGGTLNGKKYMLSLTFNAPKEAFDDPDQYLFKGKSIDDLFFWVHCNFRFFAMEPLDTFACYDVIKDPDIENDLVRLQKHLDKNFSVVALQKVLA